MVRRCLKIDLESYPTWVEGLVNMITKKKTTLCLVNFAIPAENRVKIKESEKIDKYLNLARELKKTVEHEDDTDINSS